MIDAVLGAVIMVVCTSSLVIAIEVAERAYGSAGRYPLTSSEIEMIKQAGWASDQHKRDLEADLSSVLK